MTTDDAFAGLVANRYLWKRTGQSAQLRRWYVHRLRQQQPVSLDTKVRLLLAAGLTQQPARWSLPA